MGSMTLIVGDDELLVSRALSTKIKDLDVTRVEATGLDGLGITNLMSPQLFSFERAVVINNGQNLTKKALERLMAYRDSIDADLSVVITASPKAASLIGKFNAFKLETIKTAKPKNARERLTFVKGEATRLQRRITDGGAKAIIEATDGSSRAVLGMLEQLVAETEGLITEDLVRDSFGGTPEVTGFAVADAVVSGDTASALSALRGALQTGTAPVLIASAIISSVRDITRVKALGNVSSAEAAGTLGMPPWKAEKTLRAARHWDGPSLGRALARAVQLDVQIKGGRADVNHALESAVLEITNAW